MYAWGRAGWDTQSECDRASLVIPSVQGGKSESLSSESLHRLPGGLVYLEA